MSDGKVTRVHFFLMSSNPAQKIILNEVVNLINGLGVGVHIEKGDINDLTPERKFENLEKEYYKLRMEHSVLKTQLQQQKDESIKEIKG